MGDFLLATDRGYGFICRFADLLTRNKAGKSVITLDAEASVLKPLKVQDPQNTIVLIVSKQGKMLIYRASELNILPRGKGLKLIKIANDKLKSGMDGIADIICLNEGEGANLHSGKLKLSLAQDHC